VAPIQLAYGKQVQSGGKQAHEARASHGMEKDVAIGHPRKEEPLHKLEEWRGPEHEITLMPDARDDLRKGDPD
jgi:hypothetical protein